MQNLSSYLLFVCLFIFPTISQSQVLQDKTYSANQLKADLLVFKNALQAVHPALYEFQSSGEFEERFKKVENALEDGMTDLDFLTLVSTITKPIGCGHTGAIRFRPRKESKRLKKLPIEERDTFNYLPFDGNFVEHRLFVGTSHDSLLSPTTEIFAVDGHSIEALEQLIIDYPSISNDGIGERLAKYLTKKGFFKDMYTTFFRVKDSVELVIGTKEGKVKQQFKTVKRQEMTPPSPVIYDSTEWNLKFRASGLKNKYTRTFESTYFYKHKTKNIAALRISAFMTGFKPMHNLIFDSLKAQKTEHLIIDLRGNFGGDIRALNSLLSKTLSKPHTYILAKRKIPKKVKKNRHKDFIANPSIRTLFINASHKKKRVNGQKVLSKTIEPSKENRFQGKIYVLIDGGSFSGSSIYSAILQNDGKALFFGEETGGSELVTNGATYFFPKPPNSRISIRIPRYKIEHQIAGGKKGRGVRPDYEIKETITAFLNEKDKGLEKVLSIIEASN